MTDTNSNNGSNLENGNYKSNTGSNTILLVLVVRIVVMGSNIECIRAHTLGF